MTKVGSKYGELFFSEKKAEGGSVEFYAAKDGTFTCIEDGKVTATDVAPEIFFKAMFESMFDAKLPLEQE